MSAQPRSGLLPAHHQVALCEQRRNLGHVEKRLVLLIPGNGAGIERRLLKLAVAPLRVQLDEHGGVFSMAPWAPGHQDAIDTPFTVLAG